MEISRQQRASLQQQYTFLLQKRTVDVPPEKVSVLKQLDDYYHRVKTQILYYQSLTTGLFPRYSTDKEEGHVRDSLYCAMVCWALSSAYSRIDDDRGRTYELSQSAVKTMRGILYCWLSQSNSLEEFKRNPFPEHALHSKFNLTTGAPIVPTSEYGHLQIDVVAFYLITLVQMIAGGLQIIYAQDEVKFIQNLVFYIERGYRTPDFGIWEMGTRYNDGHCELHASALGCVKAALEAINGFNLFGNRGTSGSVIYVDIDAHNRNRTTFETLLPRESNSKNTDASLISVLSFPIFATHAGTVYDRTMDKVLRKLSGQYGMKRFLRDGFGTAICDRSRRFYNAGETKLFDGIECQWPMFLAFLIIENIFHDRQTRVDKYKAKLEPLLINSTKYGLLLPQYYYVPEESILPEKSQPGSQAMQPSTTTPDGDIIYLLGQSIYLIASLLEEKLVLRSEIDPIHRHLPASQRPKFSNRHSVFQTRDGGDNSIVGSINDPTVQIALISESARLQSFLSTYGIQTQTPHQVEPVQIWSSNDLVRVFENLGRVDRLKLSGRPLRPIGSLGTCKVYRVYGNTVLCYPIWLEVNDFYLATDAAVVSNYIKKEINFVARRWKLAGRPTVCMLLREESIAGEMFAHILELLVAFKNGYVEGTRVRLGRVQNLLAAGCIEHLDFADSQFVPGEHGGEDEGFGLEIKPFKSTQLEGMLGSTFDVSANVCVASVDSDFNIIPHRNSSDAEIIAMIREQPVGNLNTQAQLLNLLRERHDFSFETDAGNVKQRFERVYHQACLFKQWFVVRYCAAVLHKVVDSLAPSITSLLVRGKQITVGLVGKSEEVIDKPVNPSEFVEQIFRVCMPYEMPAAVFEQELVLALDHEISVHPQLFTGTLKIRLGWVIRAMDLLVNWKRPDPSVSVYSLYPMEVKKLVHDVLSPDTLKRLSPLQQRQINGALNRVPHDFYDRAWRTLEKTPGGIIVASNHLPQQPTLSDMTEFELTFALTIDQLLSAIVHAEYRSIIVELFMVVSTILQRNPELTFSGILNMDHLVRDAFELFQRERGIEKSDDMTPFYEQPSLAKTGTASYLARAVVNSLLKGNFAAAAHDYGNYINVGESSCSLM